MMMMMRRCLVREGARSRHESGRPLGGTHRRLQLHRHPSTVRKKGRLTVLGLKLSGARLKRNNMRRDEMRRNHWRRRSARGDNRRRRNLRNNSPRRNSPRRDNLRRTNLRRHGLHRNRNRQTRRTCRLRLYLLISLSRANPRENPADRRYHRKRLRRLPRLPSLHRNHRLGLADSDLPCRLSVRPGLSGRKTTATEMPAMRQATSCPAHLTGPLRPRRLRPRPRLLARA
jgi:hypothetical protein